MRSKNVLAESLNHVRVQHLRSHAGDPSASLQSPVANRWCGTDSTPHQAITVPLQAIAWKY